MRNVTFRYLFALLLFGSNGIVASLIDLSSQHIVLLRTLIGSVFLIAIFFMTGGKLTFHQHKRQLFFLAVSGMAMGASWMCLYEAYARIGVSVASLLYYCGPVIVVVLSTLLFKERLSPNTLIGFAAVIAGVLCINGNVFSGSSDITGILCGLLSALLYALMVICNRMAKEITGLENATLQLTAAFFTVAVFTGLKNGFAMHLTSTSILPILILGLLNTGVGCYLYFSSIGKLKVQTVAVCGYVEPLSAVLLSAIFLNERMLPLQIAGAAMIIGGAVFSELHKHRST